MFGGTAGAGEGRRDVMLMLMGAEDGQSDGTDHPPASWQPLRLETTAQYEMVPAKGAKEKGLKQTVEETLSGFLRNLSIDNLF